MTKCEILKTLIKERKKATKRLLSNVKTECEILKTLIKQRKKATKRLVLPPSFPPYFTQIDEILGCGDVMTLPEKTEVGANSISDDEINAIQIIINPMF